MIKKALLVLVALVAIFVIVVALRPSEFRISRSIKITAPALSVFSHVNNLHSWEAWSPWVKLDPHAKNTFEGPVEGVGAALSWDGNDEVGVGKMTITESRPGEVVVFRLDFKKPFEATNTAEFSFVPDGEATVVTWSMFGTNNFISKAVGLFLDCDKMVGGAI